MFGPRLSAHLNRPFHQQINIRLERLPPPFGVSISHPMNTWTCISFSRKTAAKRIALFLWSLLIFRRVDQSSRKGKRKRYVEKGGRTKPTECLDLSRVSSPFHRNIITLFLPFVFQSGIVSTIGKLGTHRYRP